MSVICHDDAFQQSEVGEENADHEISLEQIVNESDVLSESEFIVDVGEEEITVEQLSKAINHSYINLKRQNPLHPWLI